MPRIKLQIVRPYAGASYGQFVATNREITRRKILTKSLNRALVYLRQNAPEIVKCDDFIQYFNRNLNNSGRERFATSRPLRVGDFNERWGWDNASDLLKILNNVQSDLKVEFVLSGSRGIPNAEIRIFNRRQPIDNDHENDFRSAWPLGIRFEIVNRGLPDKVYRESKIYRVMAKIFGNISRGSLSGMLDIGSQERLVSPFIEILRPRSKTLEERRFIIRRDKPVAIRGTVPVFFAEINGFTVALKEEIEEIIKEGRLIPAHQTETEKCYFTPELLAEWEGRGDIWVDKSGKDRKYFFANRIGDLFNKGIVKIPRRLMPQASETFLNFMRNHELSRRERHACPMLAAAIDILSSSPRGTDPYFEAAKIAAERGAKEHDLVVILLQGIMPEKSANNLPLPENIESYLREIYLQTSDPSPYEYNYILYGILRSREASDFNLGSMPIESAADIRKFLIAFSNILAFDHFRYFPTILGKLRHMRPGELDLGAERHLRVAVTSMGECLGFADLAALIRNEAFRITHNSEYEPVRQAVEAALGLSYSEAELHLHNTAEIIHEALAKIGISAEDYDILVRVKTPYSVWEKMRNYKIEKVGWLHDLLGISVVAKDDRSAYRLAGIIEQILPELSPENVNDRHGLVTNMKKRGLEFYTDEIADPKPSGFSAITMMRVTDLGLPMEVQITSRKRDKINRQGRAAHWKLKFLREVKHLYPEINVDEFGDLSEFNVT